MPASKFPFREQVVDGRECGALRTLVDGPYRSRRPENLTEAPALGVRFEGEPADEIVEALARSSVQR